MRNSQLYPHCVSGSASPNNLARPRITHEGGGRWKAGRKLLQEHYTYFMQQLHRLLKNPTTISKVTARTEYIFSTRDKRQMQGFGLSKQEKLPSYTALSNRMTAVLLPIAGASTYDT